MASKFHPLRVKDIHQETDECVSIVLEVPEELKANFSFKAGQFLNFRFKHNGEELRRSYSLCAAPYENQLKVAVKQISDGIFSNFVKAELQVNDTLEVMEPTGNFTTEINESNKKGYVMVAAGSGITPIMALTKQILKDEPHSTVNLFYGNRGASSVIFREELESIKDKYMSRFSLVHVFSQENLGNDIQNGRIDDEKFKEFLYTFLKGVDIDEIFVCGPESMMISLKNLNEAIELVPEKNFHFELFDTSIGNKKKETTEKAPISQGTTDVEVIIDGDSFHFTMDRNQSILDAGLEAGADLPFSCKGGVCGTCRAKLLQGNATMDVNYALNEDEVENGVILTCQAHPTTDKIVVSFDE